MSCPCQTESSRQALLHELFEAATHEASAAMCRWTGGLITVDLDEVCEAGLEEIGQSLAQQDELLTMVVLTVPGEIGGTLILAFDEANGRKLATSLLGLPRSATPTWSTLEMSALTETGNILGCAYFNALTRLLGVNLVPTAPSFLQDYGASVLQQAIMPQLLVSDRVVLCQLRFRREGEQLDWRVVFVPTLGLQEALQQSLDAAPWRALGSASVST